MNVPDLKSMPGREQSEDPGKVNKNIINKGLNLFGTLAVVNLRRLRR